MSSRKVKYTLVFQPAEEGINFIKSIKDKLRTKIGWFTGCNTLAKLTVAEFYADEQELAILKIQLQELCVYEKAQYVYFNDFNLYPKTGAFFLSPTIKAKQFLKDKVKAIATLLTAFDYVVSEEPHLTIARKLNMGQLLQVESYNRFIDFDFFCSSIFLKRFDEQQKQHQLIQEFKFGNQTKPIPAIGQLSLF